MLDAILSFTCDMARGVERTLIRPALMTGDNQAHTFRVALTRDGAAAAVEGAFVLDSIALIVGCATPDIFARERWDNP